MIRVSQNEVFCDFKGQLDATLIQIAYDYDFGIPELCRELGVSRTSLHRKITACTGKSISIYIREFRLNKAMELLQTTTQPVSNVAYGVGFSDLAYFSRCFKEIYGLAPSNFRRQYNAD